MKQQRRRRQGGQVRTKELHDEHLERKEEHSYQPLEFVVQDDQIHPWQLLVALDLHSVLAAEHSEEEHQTNHPAQEQKSYRKDY